ncbi:MAG: hypothetical protein A3I05_02410 [Deltaproteobacteria bacterium RIFCSPLOWO2_02_FULL_44_10]|nr:MAG: hypothetical protein A3I05_02410 [Deltaproteobacteria bacterium RIFCSPLOWO2_02_FULL_44_10]
MTSLEEIFEKMITSFIIKLRQRPFTVFLFARFFSVFGYIGLLSVLPILLRQAPFHFAASRIAVLLGIFGLADRGLGLLCTSLVLRFGYRKSILVGSLIPGCSLFVLCFLPSFEVSAMSFVLFGVGSSLTSLAIRLWIASSLDEAKKIDAYGRLYRMINFAGGLAPVLIFLLPYKEYAEMTLIGVASLYILAAIIIFFLFKTDTVPSREMLDFFRFITSIKHNLHACRKVLPFYIVQILSGFALNQMHVVPYYFDSFLSMPQLIGFALALNCFLIVFFQSFVSHLFRLLLKKSVFLAFATGFFSFFLSFLSFTLLPSSVSIWFYIVFLTIGEMMIFPNMDYMITARTPQKLHPVFLAGTGLIFAMSRSFAEGGSVFSFGWLHKNGFDPKLWWFFNLFLFMLISLFLGYKSFFAKNCNNE